MKSFFFLLFALPLLATVNEPPRLEVFTGYRNDRIHWHLQDPGEGGELLSSELYRDVQFLENGLRFKVIHRDLVFSLSGDYAALGRGVVSQRPSHTHFNTTGWAADGTGLFGYAANLTAGRTYKVLVIPLLGFSGHFEDLHTSANQLRFTWYGFLLGGSFLIEPGGPLIFEAGYTYHWLHLYFKNQSSASFLRIKEPGNLGQTGWAQLDFRLPSLWRIGLGAAIHYFSSRVVSVKEVQGDATFDRKFKLRYTPISGWVQVSKGF